jgi:arginine:ornithine antiporter/lysine permease
MESRQALMDTPGAAIAVTGEQTQKFSLFALTMMVVGSMVGAGIFSLPRAFGNATGPFGAIVAWAIAARASTRWRACSRRSPSASPISTPASMRMPRPGFGDYPGFLSAFGYFISACLGNTFYWVLIKSTEDHGLATLEGGDVTPIGKGMS